MDNVRKAVALEKFVQGLLDCSRDLPIYIIQTLEDISTALEEGDIEDLEVVVNWFLDEGE